SAQLQQPYVMLGFNILAADTDEEARFLATSLMQAFVNLRSGAPTKLPPPKKGYEERLAPAARATLEQVLSCSAVGGPETVRSRLTEFIARTGADELILTAQMHDHQKRRRAFEIAAEARAALAKSG
ncbi:MAG: hypothetical protein RIE56_14180, partial [Amphiplicatus sp.]